jgi:hypothetical protein
MQIHVKDGTPLHSDSLCRTCSHAHIEKGFGESEQLVVCQGTYPDHLVKFRVRQCSGYDELKRQTLREMEKIAWVLEERASSRLVGFVSPPDAHKKEHEVELTLSDKKKA